MTPTEKINEERRTDDGDRDYREFLAKAKREEEKAEKKRQMEVREAEQRKKEFNMSPWASRM